MIETILRIKEIQLELLKNNSNDLQNELKVYEIELSEHREKLIIKQNNYENFSIK